MTVYSNVLRRWFAGLLTATFLLLPAASQAGPVSYFPVGVPGDMDAIRRAEAELLALEVSGELLAPADVRDRILCDLNAIRAAYPEMANITAQEKWDVGAVTIKVSDCLAQSVVHGDLSAFGEIFAALGTPMIFHEQWVGVSTFSLYFNESYHPEVLSKMLSEIKGVESAEPNSWNWFQIKDVDVSGSCYTFQVGGCFEPFQSWTFCVEGGKVTMCPEPQSLVLGMTGMIALGFVAVRGRRPLFLGRNRRSEMATVSPTREDDSLSVRGDNFVTWPARRSACEAAHDAIVERLRTSKTSVDARNAEGDTLLHIACRTGSLTTVQALITAGASVTAVNNSGQTPLDEAIANGHELVAGYLRKATS